MKKLRFFIFANMTILFTFLLANCGGVVAKPIKVPASALAGDLVDLEPCKYKASKVNYEADCGWLIVPENRSDSDSRLIALPVIQVHAFAESPAEPIFWFAGGPGNTNMTFSHMEGLIENHDIVMVGYRGVDGSVVMDCPEMARAAKSVGDDFLSEPSLSQFGEAEVQCAERLESEGVDLDGYSISQVVVDMEAARKALAYEQVNLLSGSYGTRVAMIYAWMYPQSLHRSAMISVNPPGHFVWEPEDIDALIEYDGKLCAGDANCSARTADLAETMQNIADNMPERWLLFRIDPGKVRFITHFMFFHRGTSAAAIDAYLAAKEGDPSGLALMSQVFNFMIPSTVIWGDWAAKGSIDYHIPRDWIDEMNPPNSILGSPTSTLVGGALQLRSGWPVAPMPDDYLEIQPSDVETLLVSGSIDYSTPSQYATEELLPALSNGQQVILSEYGHVDDIWTFQPEATKHLLTTFYNTGEVDDSQFAYQPMNYEVGLMNFPLLAKVLVAAIILVTLIVIGVTGIIIRKVRKHST